MTSNCDKENPNCSLNVGDLVDWKHSEYPPSEQARFWHGQIVDRWNTDREGTGLLSVGTSVISGEHTTVPERT